MDTLFEKIFPLSKHSETSLIKKLTTPQVFMKNSDSLLENMPIEYQQQLLENSLYSTDFKNTDPSNDFKTNVHDLFSTFSHNMLQHIPIVGPCSNLIQEYNKLVNKSVGTVAESIAEVASEGSSLSDLIVSIADASSPNKKAHFNAMKECKTAEVASERSSFLDLLVSIVNDSTPIKKPLFNTMKECKTAEVAPEGSSLSDPIVSIADASSPNKKAHFNTMKEHKNAEVASEGSSLSDLKVTIADASSPNKKAHFNTMKEHKTAEVSSEGSTFSDLLVVSVADASSPNKKAHFNIKIFNSLLNPLNNNKKISKEDCNLTQQMANRKTKEMQKRSKKRRRRQKKSNTSSTTSKDIQNHQKEVNCDASPITASEEENCDILCDVNVSPNSKSVQIVLPNLSSFVVTIESGDDDDSDWDTNSGGDWLADDSDFQVSGLFVASFSATNAYSSHTNEPDNKEPELSLIEANLKEVNRIWNEQNACLKTKPKSSTLVSFAADEELEEICPVEMYERKGEWEIFATERLRFKKRVSELEDILNPCLLPEHRAKIYSTLYENVL